MNPAGAIQTREIRTLRPIMADSRGNMPARVELLQVGVWKTLNHGDFEITANDLQEYVVNFNAGVALPGNGKDGAPVDYKHDEWAEAAGWIKKLFIEGSSLFAEVEWTPTGRQKILDGEFKYISPSFCPRYLNGYEAGWVDPEDPWHVVPNVLRGAGLTNIPLFKSLSSVEASRDGHQVGDVKNAIYIIASEKELRMDLATVRAKSADELTEEEKTFVAQNKEQLTAEEQAKFGLEVTPAPVTNDDPNKNNTNGGEPVTQVAPELAEVAASIKSGKMVAVDASEYKSMQEQLKSNTEQLTELRRQEVESRVKAHAARGAIKADQVEVWTGKIMADASNEDLLKGIPDNTTVAASMKGTDTNAGDATDKAAKLDQEARKIVEASEGKVNYAQAIIQASEQNPELADYGTVK